jgi:hypothetical protein
MEGGYHITGTAAFDATEYRRGLGAALRPSCRGGRWFESTVAHHAFRNTNRSRGKADSRLKLVLGVSTIRHVCRAAVQGCLRELLQI